MQRSKTGVPGLMWAGTNRTSASEITAAEITVMPLNIPVPDAASRHAILLKHFSIRARMGTASTDSFYRWLLSWHDFGRERVIPNADQRALFSTGTKRHGALLWGGGTLNSVNPDDIDYQWSSGTIWDGLLCLKSPTVLTQCDSNATMQQIAQVLYEYVELTEDEYNALLASQVPKRGIDALAIT